MFLENITGALIHLSMAFDPKETPQGAAFWADVRRRLNDYRSLLLSPLHLLGDHTYPGPNIVRSGLSADIPSLKPLYAFAAGQSIDGAFTWDATKEGDRYWGAIAEILRKSGDYEPPTKLDGLAGNYIPYAEERGQLRVARLEIPEFTKELWYRPGQWPHHDPEQPGLIRYIPPGKPALSKSFVSAKPGKFLAAFYGDALTEPLIADFAAKFRADSEVPELLLARTADEIAHVYASGPSSCMSNGKKVADIESCRAYASPDLAIAYYKRSGSIVARALVWPEKKIHSKIYGDAVVFEKVLARNKYRNVHKPLPGTTPPGPNEFVGARLVPLRPKNVRPAYKSQEDAGEPVLIAPYFDISVGGAWFDGEWLRLGAPPSGKTPHKLAGGYSLHCITADKLPYHPNSRDHLSVFIGHQGGNTMEYWTLTTCGRTSERTTADAAKEALAAKQAGAQAEAAQQAAIQQLVGLQPNGIVGAQMAAYQRFGRLA